MTQKLMKLKSLKDLKIAAYPDTSRSEMNIQKWNEFLIQKGHTRQTFSYLPEEIKLSLRMSFARKNH